MPTQTVTLTEHHQAMIDDLVTSGRYQDAGEVLREGLRLVEQREAVRLRELRDASNIGFEDLAAGRFRDIGDEELDDFLRELGKRASAAAQ